MLWTLEKYKERTGVETVMFTKYFLCSMFLDSFAVELRLYN